MKRIVYISFIALLVLACKKEPLPDLPDETGPYYSIKGHIDNEPVDLNVGQEGILISQGISIENGIPSYFGQIVSPSEDLLIRIEFTRPEVPLNAQGLTAINQGNVPFLVHQSGCLYPSFGSNILQSNYLLVKNESGVFEPISEFSFDEYGVHNLTIDFTDDAQNSFQLPISYGYEPVKLNPKFQAGAAIDSVNFSAFHSSGTHEWYVNGEFVSNAASFTHKLPIGIHKIQHIVTDENSNSATHTTLVRITDYVFDWMMDVNPCSGTFAATNYGKVTVTVLTNNKEYSSDYSAENLVNTFTISEVEYVGNSSMEPTRAVFDMYFNCVLVDEDGTDSLSLSGMSGTFNVGLQ